ncbi:MAG: hypothetical protein ACRCU2_18515 [Planktothrix sp.]
MKIQKIQTIKFQSGQTYNSPLGPVKVIRDRRSSFIWLYRGQKRLQGGLVDVVGGQEVFTLKGGSMLYAASEPEDVYCTDPAILPIDRSFQAIATELHYVIGGVAYPRELFLAF